MNTLTLPEILRPTPALSSMNRALADGTGKLDWSQVRGASHDALKVLLAGLNLERHADVLGLETVPDNLIDVLRPLLDPDPNAAIATAERGSDASQHGQLGTDGASGDAALLKPPSQWQIREEFTDLVLRDLLGPAGGPEEEVTERRMYDRYLVGMLAPRRSTAELDSDEGDVQPLDDDLPPDDGTDSGGAGDPPLPLAVGPRPRVLVPSAFGLSFCVDRSVSAIEVTARWGRYERLSGSDGKLVWKRVPVEGTATLSLSQPLIKRWRPCAEQEGVVVDGWVKDRREQGYQLVTLFLRNEQEEPKRGRDKAWLFQAELSVSGAGEQRGSPDTFCRHQHVWSGDSGTLSDERSLAMLYRRELEFAHGHNIAVHVETLPGRPDRAVRISTRAVPQYDVPASGFPSGEERPLLEGLVLDMHRLGQVPDAETLCAWLQRIPVAYDRWIAEREGQLGSDPSLAEYASSGEAALARCRTASARIREGIALLHDDGQAFEAFRFMNRAMALQRVHTVFAEQRRRGVQNPIEAIDQPPNRSWRPFQLAFILLNLPGIAQLDHPDRACDANATMDLLWFPTGGGKTEAYLGLAAFTFAIRRLQGVVGGRDGDEGLAVLMRYTLRLLTLQQFQRATALICACEVLRRESCGEGDYRWGETPFRIGLWVGRSMTPNDWHSAAEWLEHRREGSWASSTGSPVQLTHCPWCGTEIQPGKHIRAERLTRRVLIFCGDALGDCPFSERLSPQGLPVVVTDEEIYRLLPAMLIATVDKFAQMPWNGATKALFGRVSRRCSRHGFRTEGSSDWEHDSHPKSKAIPAASTETCIPPRPPDLIIQDELHLISGPLGTLVGLYETAIDRLATWTVNGREIRPKVVASTATIRRAERQSHALFLRSVQVFPPDGLDVEDNFFSVQRSPSEAAPGRRYLGICAQGRRLKAAMIRVYVAHLAAAQVLYERYGAHADPWMTLVGYFNAMRELGGMRRVIDDDVTARLRKTIERGLARRNKPIVEELTSRRSSADIPRVLSRLEIGFNPNVQADKSQRERPIDVLLATNMLSVGVDVPRLGLMVVAAQPKTTAEYIQATSRVGRGGTPGLVCDVFQWARPRDLSHYERFEQYHATFYQQVEALSVTPFAARARDRGLSALLAALVRLEGDRLNANLDAAKIQAHDPLALSAIDGIANRAGQVTGDAALVDVVRSELTTRLNFWIARARQNAGGARLGYRDVRDGKTVGLLQDPSNGSWELFTCPTSLRDVEPSVALMLNPRVLDDGLERDWGEQVEEVTARW